MSNQFVAEIRIFGCNFAPTGWAFCNGQLLPISQNTALFSLLGTQYGGDGKSTFALPNMQGNSPMHQGQGQGLSQRFIGEESGVENVTLLISEMPAHNHTLGSRNTAGNQALPTGNIFGPAGTQLPLPNYYSNALANTQSLTSGLGISGSSLPHNNMMPYLTLNFCIALQGIFPPRS